eukprot:CAMPEP_0197667248 /NCGR_PEP_ID=MMETSP1338-20131121/65631_1 /TAXON_ID=43686 ORGANISM="Pelagodinium beii, Strain RCC1491" /NCGR_SAMPLE_ID=MMETSP1338 /ASSEMBLY_ACC=CAM_ASM_000754 /LENGTH=41 /DNA_ID= /DNA_START= /DNA_END= /DNA_ORIENTATION=
MTDLTGETAEAWLPMLRIHGGAGKEDAADASTGMGTVAMLT